MTVNISAKFSKEDRPRNGLVAILERLVDDNLQHAEYWVLGRIRPNFYKVSAEDGARTPTVEIGHIEVALTESDIALVREVLQRIFKDRTGLDDAPPPDLFSVLGDGDQGDDGERQVPEASAEEILAERAERKASEAEQERVDREQRVPGLAFLPGARPDDGDGPS